MSTSKRRFPDSPDDPQIAAIKLPPHSIEAEQSLIGGILLDNGAWERIADFVTESDFYRDDHRRIYRHIAKLIDPAAPTRIAYPQDRPPRLHRSQYTMRGMLLGRTAATEPTVVGQDDQ